MKTLGVGLLWFLALLGLHAGACLNEYTPNHKKVEKAQSIVESLTHVSLIEPWDVRVRRLKAAVAKNAADYKSRNDLASALLHVGEVNGAIELLEELEKSRPGAYQTASNLGTAYELAGEPEKALLWIQKAMELNPLSHKSSEWIHVRLLEAKIALAKDPAWLTTHSLLGVDFGAAVVPMIPSTLPAGNKGARLALPDVEAGLRYQLHERLQFVKPPDDIVALLLFDLGNALCFSRDGMGSAQGVYELASRFGEKLPAQTKVLFQQRAALAKQWNGTSNLAGHLPLGWLVSEQNPDGSFGTKQQALLTGLSALAFLAHGETQESERFGPQVAKAMDWLKSLGVKNSGRFSDDGKFDAAGQFQHAVCTVTVGEYYTMTLDETIREVFANAVSKIVQTMQKDEPQELSLLSWNVTALRSAQLSKLALPEVDVALRRAARRLNELELQAAEKRKAGLNPKEAEAELWALPYRVHGLLQIGEERGNLRWAVDWFWVQVRGRPG